MLDVLLGSPSIAVLEVQSKNLFSCGPDTRSEEPTYQASCKAVHIWHELHTTLTICKSLLPDVLEIRFGLALTS